MKKTITVLGLVLVLVLCLSACAKANKDMDDADDRKNVSAEARSIFEEIKTDNLVITNSYLGESDSIAYKDVIRKYEARSDRLGGNVTESFGRHIELETIMEAMFDNARWYEEELETRQIQKIEESLSLSRYYSFANGQKEWVFIEDSNTVIYRDENSAKYYSRWNDGREAIDQSVLKEGFEYLKTYGIVSDEAEEIFRDMWSYKLHIEYNSVYGRETLHMAELIDRYEKYCKITGTESVLDWHMDQSFKGMSLFTLNEWYKEDVTEETILRGKSEIEQGEYFRFFSDEGEEWIVNKELNTAIYCNSIDNIYAYYTIWDESGKNIIGSDCFKQQYDYLSVNGIDSDSGVFKVMIPASEDTKMSDEELAGKIFEEYEKIYTTVLPDNTYGASEMKLTDLKCLEGTDIDGRQIDDTHKVFVISFAAKYNESWPYAWFFGFGTGEWEDWMMMSYNFYVDKVDSTWYLTRVSSTISCI